MDRYRLPLITFLCVLTASCAPSAFSWSEKIKVGYGDSFFENGHHGYVSSPSILIGVNPECSDLKNRRCLTNLYIGRFVNNLNAINPQIVAVNVKNEKAFRKAYLESEDIAKKYCFKRRWKNRNDCKPYFVNIFFTAEKISKEYEFTYSSPELGYSGDGTVRATCSGFGNVINCSARENQTLQITGYTERKGYGLLEGIHVHADVHSQDDFISTDTSFYASLNDNKCDESRVIEFMIDSRMTLSRLIQNRDGNYSLQTGNPCP